MESGVDSGSEWDLVRGNVMMGLCLIDFFSFVYVLGEVFVFAIRYIDNVKMGFKFYGKRIILDSAYTITRGSIN